MGVFDKILGRKGKDEAERKPDFSRVRTGSESTLGERPPPAAAPSPPAGGTAAHHNDVERGHDSTPGVRVQRSGVRGAVRV